MAKPSEDFQIGVKYPGYGWINKFNEFQFTPSKIGSRKEQKKLLKEEEDYTVYYTKKKLIFHLTIDRKLERMNRIQMIIKLMNEFIKLIQEYEI